MSPTKSSSIGGWTSVLAERHARDQFAKDMTRLRELSSAFTGQPAWQHDTLYDQLLADLSGEARRAITAVWPTFQSSWDAA